MVGWSDSDNNATDLPESHLAQRGCQRKSTLFESKIRVTDLKSRTIRGN